MKGAKLELLWTERKGTAAVEQAERGGFGIRVIRASVERQLGRRRRISIGGTTDCDASSPSRIREAGVS